MNNLRSEVRAVILRELDPHVPMEKFEAAVDAVVALLAPPPMPAVASNGHDYADIFPAPHIGIDRSRVQRWPSERHMRDPEV